MTDAVVLICNKCKIVIDPANNEIMGPKLEEDVVEWMEAEFGIEAIQGQCISCRLIHDRIEDEIVREYY